MTEPTEEPAFIDRLGMSEGLKAILKRSAREFEERGDWVSFDTLAYEAAEEGRPDDLNEIFKMPSILGGAWSEEKVSMTGLGLVEAGTAPRTVEMMARLARICGERKLRLRDDATIGRAVLVSEYDFSDEDAARALQLIQLLPGIHGGGNLGDQWSLAIRRTALDYRDVDGPETLRERLEQLAAGRIAAHQQALAVAPAFAPEGMFGNAFGMAERPVVSDTDEPIDPTAVFVVHGRDREARDALWSFLEAIGLHPLDWEDDLVAHTGQGTPFVGQILDVAFQRAMAVVVLITPDDVVRLHPDLLLEGDETFEEELTCQPRPNVLFEAGMAFGFSPTRTVLVEIGRRRPVSDLGGRHTVRLGTEDTLRALARRLEVAGCAVDRAHDPTWSDPHRFSNLAARSRRSFPADGDGPA